MAQRQQYQPKLLPDIDRRLAVWQAYLNCVNAFQGLTTDSTTDSMEGMTHAEMTSAVSLKRFAFCLGDLDGQLEEEKDDEFKREVLRLGIEQPDMAAMLIAIREEKVDEFYLFRYWKELDKLMKRSQFFRGSSRFEGHL